MILFYSIINVYNQSLTMEFERIRHSCIVWYQKYADVAGGCS